MMYRTFYTSDGEDTLNECFSCTSPDGLNLFLPDTGYSVKIYINRYSAHSSTYILVYIFYI